MPELAVTGPAASMRRAELRGRGGASASRCYQCATCSSVCELARTAARPFPRQQMHWAQWGLVDRLAADPSVWLCHQCNDCSTRCPRDARPGDVLQAARALVVEKLAAPRFMGALVGGAARTWPLLIGAPILFWLVLLWAVQGQLLRAPEGPLATYGQVVSHRLIYAVYFSISGLVLLAALIGARRVWSLWGEQGPRRSGSFAASLFAVLGEILTHRRFGLCDTARPRRWGHWVLLMGFVGAALTSGLIIVAMYGLRMELPIPQVHPFKVLGNVSAIFLVVGGCWLLVNRLHGDRVGRSRAFDNFFLGVVLLLIATGVLTELGRYALPPRLAFGIYVVHLGAVLCLFATFPYSKLAHLLYRTLAMVHERMAARAGSVAREPLHRGDHAPADAGR